MTANLKTQLTAIANLLMFLLLVPCGLIVSAAYVPRLPYVGFLGTMLLTRYTPWFVVAPFFIACVAFALWRRNRIRSTLVLAILGLLAASGAGFIFMRMVMVSHENGVAVDLIGTFSTRWVDNTVQPDALIPYAGDESGPLQIAIYRPHPAANPARPAPILMYVHGGGWMVGSELQHNSEMRWFADRGWLVVSAGYTLSNAQQHLWDRNTAQVGCAMAWVAAHAAQYGGDASRFSLTGDSAGANLAINAAYQANQGILKTSCPATDPVALPHVAAVVANYPVLDPASFFTNTDRMFGNSVRAMAFAYTGGTPAQFPDRYQAIASRTYISSTAPPTLLIAAGSDHLVPIEPAQQFTRHARAAGVPVTLIRFPFAEHGFDDIDGSIGNQLFLQATLHFMQSHGQTP